MNYIPLSQWKTTALNMNKTSELLSLQVDVYVHENVTFLWWTSLRTNEESKFSQLHVAIHSLSLTSEQFFLSETLKYVMAHGDFRKMDICFLLLYIHIHFKFMHIISLDFALIHMKNTCIHKHKQRHQKAALLLHCKAIVGNYSFETSVVRSNSLFCSVVQIWPIPLGKPQFA